MFDRRKGGQQRAGLVLVAECLPNGSDHRELRRRLKTVKDPDAGFAKHGLIARIFDVVPKRPETLAEKLTFASPQSPFAELCSPHVKVPRKCLVPRINTDFAVHATVYLEIADMPATIHGPVDG
jgi:hypothetical protein